jgi:hypothetical protein
LVIGRRGAHHAPRPGVRRQPWMLACRVGDGLPGTVHHSGHPAAGRGRIDTHPAGGAMATGEGGSPIPVAAWCAAPVRGDHVPDNGRSLRPVMA